MPTLQLKGKIFEEPVKKLTFPGLGQTAIFELVPGPNICNFIVTLTVTGSATGGATKTIPRPSWGIGDMRFKVGNFNRTRRASELFGINGLQARNSRKTAGTVQYIQGGVFVTAVLSGRTIGNTPVLIDSNEDLTIQAALQNNLQTIAIFCLPWMFAEYWRNDPMFGGSALGLRTAFDDGNGNIGSVLGTPYFELDVPAATAALGTMTAVALAAGLSYTEELAVAGSQVPMSKQKVHTANYAVGDNELGLNFETKGILQRFSILCGADTITKVVVKQGSRIVREVSFRESHCADLCCEIEGESAIANRFDIDLDQDDDPTRALPLSTTQNLSIIATFATANDNPATARILADYWGPVEN